MWIRVQLTTLGTRLGTAGQEARGTAHEQVSLHMLSTAAVGRTGGGPDIQHNYRPEQPKQPDTKRDCSGEQLEPVNSSGFEQQF